MGVNTGQAVTGDAAAGGFFTAGDIVNVAARLEQAARPGDILVGGDTYRLVRHAVEAEPVEPLVVKGKAEPLAASGCWAWRRTRRRAALSASARRSSTATASESSSSRPRPGGRWIARASCSRVLGAAGSASRRIMAKVTDALGGARPSPPGDAFRTATG